MRIEEALNLARQHGLSRLEAQWLLAHLLGQSRSWLLAHDDEALSAAQAAQLKMALQRRATGVPFAYVLGEQEFCGLRLQVSPAVLIPRPETEELVLWALEWLQARSWPSPPRVLDLGTGSGAIALAIKHRFPLARVWASDVSPAALEVAQNNAKSLKLAVTFFQGSWWSQWPLTAGEAALPTGFDLIVSNPPYVAPGDPHLAALQHEPQGALVAGNAGLQDLQSIIEGAPSLLNAGAWLLLEHGHDQAEAVRALMQRAGLATPQTRVDLAGLPRCSGAQRPDFPSN